MSLTPYNYMLLAFVTTIHITAAQTTSPPTSAPTPQPELDTGCNGGANCDILCTENGSMDCKNKMIDASMTSHFTITCNSERICEDSTIICPTTGCNVICSGIQACGDTSIVYDGTLQDDATVNIDCTNHRSCYSSQITVNTAAHVNLNCNTPTGERGSCGWVDLYANNATTVAITAQGEYSMGYADIHAVYASQVIIDCISYDSTPKQTYFYPTCGGLDVEYWLPSNTQINCYGLECHDMNLYFEDATDLQGVSFNLDACNKCNDSVVSGCLGEIKMYCGEPTLAFYTDKESVFDVSYPQQGIHCNSACECSESVPVISFANSCAQPSVNPTKIPSTNPTIITGEPSKSPTNQPSVTTDAPTEMPTNHPLVTTKAPSGFPTVVHPHSSTSPPISQASRDTFCSFSCLFTATFFCVVYFV
eukprot:173024_1